ncbi:MAG: outer membrane beta-barrel protein [Alphaproteobacteria bacterium]|nr:outer membrane beta-barrel protein [Alphaproteobacteria bacterium]
MRLSLAPAILATLGAATFASVALASDYGVAYLGLRSSYIATEGAETAGSVAFDYNEEYATDGFGAAVFMGWVLDKNFRLEIEGGYRSADLDEVTIVRDDTATYAAGDVVDVGGTAQAGTAMVNFYYDIHLFDGAILPWIGAGLGGAYVDYSIDEPSGQFNSKDNSWVFAYQFMAGVTFPVAEGISMSAGYRYFQTQDFVYEDVFAEEHETDLTQHSFDLGLQFHL